MPGLWISRPRNPGHLLGESTNALRRALTPGERAGL